MLYGSIVAHAFDPMSLLSTHPDQVCPGMTTTDVPKIDVPHRIVIGNGVVFVMETVILFSVDVAQPDRTNRIARTTILRILLHHLSAKPSPILLHVLRLAPAHPANDVLLDRAAPVVVMKPEEANDPRQRAMLRPQPPRRFNRRHT